MPRSTSRTDIRSGQSEVDGTNVAFGIVNVMSAGLADTVGAQVRRRREQRGMTAAELARRAGLAKATLSSVESGVGNPTIETLDALAVALGLPLSDLLVRAEDGGPHVVRATPTDGEIQRELLRRVAGGHQVEMWRLRMPPNAGFDGVPHATGTIEILTVASGSVVAGPEGEHVTLGPGDLLSFAADRPHSYRTDSAAADLNVLLASPLIG